ncbi:protease HtpX homolog [Parachlamydia acanthamoebae UV-7]|uniref:Protease HtpX homolog n=1 Tax=Parachlamydia acanthamoebae (strain UV7) TaxID=765952 RepID=F8KZI3_PARAV|nr:M48 family metallopeptidase [Parachlamydia acanthamoebae]CCB86323.1 protease HtpX homolog [Parachlamydia acanthamoebae UV-7]
MNFWEAQRRAKSRTSLYVAIFVALTLIVAALSEWAFRTFSPETYDSSVPILGLLFILVTFSVAGYQYLMFKSFGGGYVAESMGAWRIDPKTNNPKERQLLNIVEEMALAASLPIPAVYVLHAKPINAFAAGLTSDNSAITITDGALQTLHRDEIQGVIAHEFGHIYNGDMKISLRLAAMVMGFFFVLYIGMRLLYLSGSINPRERNGDGRGGNPIAIAAIIFLFAGIFTWIFGSILKAAVSREREYLADACAVQFTRNPDGISNALKKIMSEQYTAMPERGMAYSHLYLDNHAGLSSLFATHPPLEKRIEAIEGRTYMPEEWKEDLDTANKKAHLASKI